MNKDIAPVLDEISALLMKHDMTGLVVVGNQTHCDWRMEVAATWSCTWIEELAGGGYALRIKSKRKDYPSAEAQKLCLEQTVGNLVTFKDTLARLDEQLEKVLVMISKNVDFLGKSTDETSL